MGIAGQTNCKQIENAYQKVFSICFRFQVGRKAVMPEVEANNKNCDSNTKGDVCAVDNLQAKQNKQTQYNNEEFASEIHLEANMENGESKSTFGNQTDKRNQLPVSERTAWN